MSDFLPLFVWVLVQCGFTRAEIEAEYMWGLAHPSLFNGEAGYYLTTLTSAINVLKETQPVVSEFPENIEDKIQVSGTSWPPIEGHLSNRNTSSSFPPLHSTSLA